MLRGYVKDLKLDSTIDRCALVTSKLHHNGLYGSLVASELASHPYPRVT